MTANDDALPPEVEHLLPLSMEITAAVYRVAEGKPPADVAAILVGLAGHYLTDAHGRRLSARILRELADRMDQLADLATDGEA